MCRCTVRFATWIPKGTKDACGRALGPIELAPRPLLDVLRAEAGGKGRPIALMPPDEDWAETVRRHLQRAGVTRRELFADEDAQAKPALRLRATGITWRALREDCGPQIQEAAGDEKYDTTDGYIRMGRMFIGRGGGPFPTLPG